MCLGGGNSEAERVDRAVFLARQVGCRVFRQPLQHFAEGERRGGLRQAVPLLKILDEQEITHGWHQRDEQQSDGAFPW